MILDSVNQQVDYQQVVTLVLTEVSNQMVHGTEHEMYVFVVDYNFFRVFDKPPSLVRGTILYFVNYIYQLYS